MGWIKRAWRGEERLWKVFWIYGVLLGFGVGIVSDFIKDRGYLIMGYGTEWVASCWWVVALWRSAFNVTWRFCGYLARILAILLIGSVIIPFVFGLTVGLMDVSSSLVRAAECQKELSSTFAVLGR